MNQNISIVGGCGHVGIPLGLALAEAGHKVTLVDINESAVTEINSGKLPFLEEGAQEVLNRVLNNQLKVTTKPEGISKNDVVFFVTGTPVDGHQNPRIDDFLACIKEYIPFLSSRQLIILRSTLYPGVTDLVDKFLKNELGSVLLAFCPERIIQGKGISEIQKLPQIVSATSTKAEEMAAELFKTIAPRIIRLTPIEAEIAKLMTNAWRYLEFAIANQFYMITEGQGLDFYKIFNALREDYPRASHYARPGFAAGPCLFKDTVQLSAFHKNNFFFGQAAIMINESLAVFLAEQMEKKLKTLQGKTIAILGMAFKADNDDTRGSLSFKLKKILEIKMAKVISSDVYLKDTVSFQKAIEEADGVILGVPHREYLNLKIDKPKVDCWGVWERTGG